SVKTLQSPVIHSHGGLNRRIRGKKYAFKTSQNGYASKSEDDDDNSKSFQNVLLKNLNALYHFIRPYACAGVVIAATSNSLLPVEKLSDLTPTFFIGLLKALVPALLMHIYVAAINQLSDVEIDKVNKPYLPLASGEFSMGTGIAITLTSVLMSLAIAIMLRSPPLVLGVIVWFLFGTAYSVQKYVLGRPVEITRSLMFATVFICCFCIASAFLKDLHDVDGDKEFGIETLSVKLGKERVFWLCVYMLSIAYGAAVVVGASSSILLSKLLTIISHCILASSLWLRARTVDLSSNTSTFSFYMFIWKASDCTYILNQIPHASCIKTLESPVTHIHGVLNRSQEKKYAIKCSQSNSFYNLTNKIASSRNCKPFNSHRAPVTLQDGYASKSEDDDHSNSFLNIIATTSNSLLPVQTLADLTPAYFTGLMEALVPAVLMHIYVVAINQLSDVEVDKVNKPYLPLASGEISMGTGIAITLASALMSLAYAVMIRSPPFIWAVIAWIFVGTAYSVQLPLLRWKGNSFLAAFCMVSLNGLLTQFPVYVHIQDLHDVDGDKKFGIKTLSVMLGKERVFRLSVSMLSIAYGAAVVVGASSPFLANKLITIIGHGILASIFWLRVRAVDLSDNASILSFYMFIWKLYYAEYLLIPFVR
ncbi:hypothetical protein CUMW_081140, partial [Citrus unshiu]